METVKASSGKKGAVPKRTQDSTVTGTAIHKKKGAKAASSAPEPNLGNKNLSKASVSVKSEFCPQVDCTGKGTVQNLNSNKNVKDSLKTSGELLYLENPLLNQALLSKSKKRKLRKKKITAIQTQIHGHKSKVQNGKCNHSVLKEIDSCCIFDKNHPHPDLTLAQVANPVRHFELHPCNPPTDFIDIGELFRNNYSGIPCTNQCCAPECHILTKTAEIESTNNLIASTKCEFIHPSTQNLENLVKSGDITQNSGANLVSKAQSSVSELKPSVPSQDQSILPFVEEELSIHCSSSCCPPEVALAEKGQECKSNKTTKLRLTSGLPELCSESDTHSHSNIDIYSSKTVDIPFFQSVLRGPIYTSPNLENRVTDSANSNQLNRVTASEIPEIIKDIGNTAKESSTEKSDALIYSEICLKDLESDYCCDRGRWTVTHQNLVQNTNNEALGCCTVAEVATNQTLQSGDLKYTPPTQNSKLEMQHIVATQENKSNTMQKSEKSREEVKAEREAKKAAKQAKKSKVSAIQSVPENQTAANCNKNKELPETSTKTSLEPKTTIVSVGMSNCAEKREKTTMNNECNNTEEKSEPSLEAGATKQLDGKSKAELRAERRAKQEAQRAAKLQQQQQPQIKTLEGSNKSKPKPVLENQAVKQSEKTAKPAIVKQEVPKKQEEHRVKLFNHLYNQQYSSAARSLLEAESHPAIIRLGVQYESKVIVGSNARCLALLSAMKQVVEDYKTPPQKEFARGLESTLHTCTSYLQSRRPLSVSMTNALRYLKWQLTQLPNNITDEEAKKKLQDAIDTYIREQVEVAGLAICNTVLGKISSGDTILTYGSSSLIQRILIKAHKSGTKFHVVIVDGLPWREGKEMLRRLVKSGLKCSYVLLTATSFIMREVTKVLLGAHALLANGYVMSRSGASQVALLAHSCNVPVLVCCETHKFCERVQTDSFVYNEIGNPDELVALDSVSRVSPAVNWKSMSFLTPLNLTYDVTPPDLVTAVVTELAILPCTSVPVILRIKPSESGF